MFGGYPHDEDDDDFIPPPPGGRGGLLGNLAAGLAAGSMRWDGQHVSRAPPHAYDEYFKAYSVAMLPGRERSNLSYGGKIIMPPSALARLTNLEIESPWTFQLRNPSNPAASTHCGVLEFIAEEGCVNLPYWMMKTLRLNEGDPIRITGAKLPKGKLIKIQAQQVHFLEVSDPKAVLEQALRNFTCLTAGDMIELSYNSIVFEFLIMEAQPPGSGIMVVDTDLEVDFAAPKGYVEPVRPAPAPLPTMATKHKIDLNSSTPQSSRPSSALATTSGTAAGGEFESFKGLGQTLGGRKTKGKGKSVRKITEVDPDSKIFRTDKARMVTNDTLLEGRQVPAALNLPFGKLFFGFAVVPYKANDAEDSSGSSSPQLQNVPFGGGAGHTLSGGPSRQPDQTTRQAAPPPSGNAKPASEKKWKGEGQKLSGQSSAPRRRASTPDYIEVDSD